MVIKLTGGKIYDPANKVSGEVRDVYVEDGKIVGAPADGRVARLRSEGPRGDGRRHRPAHSHRRRQGNDRAHADARRIT